MAISEAAERINLSAKFNIGKPILTLILKHFEIQRTPLKQLLHYRDPETGADAIKKYTTSLGILYLQV